MLDGEITNARKINFYAEFEEPRRSLPGIVFGHHVNQSILCDDPVKVSGGGDTASYISGKSSGLITLGNTTYRSVSSED